MKKMKKILAVALIALTMMAVAMPALALTGSYDNYLRGSSSMYNIRQGHTGEHVANLQRALNALGYNCGTPDGIFGSNTLAAVKAFQEDYLGKSEADGIVGKKTKDAIWAALNYNPCIPLR